MIDIASAMIEFPDKGEDRILVRKLGGAYLLAVADGLTGDNGRAAAEWAKQFLQFTNNTESARDVFEALKSSLANEQRTFEDSRTTLSCGILSETERFGIQSLHFDFFAIGDSPIWRLVLNRNGKHLYQRYLIHGGPYPAETSKVYSTLRLKEKAISGNVAFGSAEFGEDEVLVVCSDGIPERQVMVRDFDITSETYLPKLCQLLFDHSRYQDAELQTVLAGYEQSELLYDDTSIIVARLDTKPARFQNKSDGSDFDECDINSDSEVLSNFRTAPELKIKGPASEIFDADSHGLPDKQVDLDGNSLSKNDADLTIPALLNSFKDKGDTQTDSVPSNGNFVDVPKSSDKAVVDKKHRVRSTSRPTSSRRNRKK
jgi:serine/threonine protein phosphatase PrpC